LLSLCPNRPNATNNGLKATTRRLLEWGMLLDRGVLGEVGNMKIGSAV